MAVLLPTATPRRHVPQYEELGPEPRAHTLPGRQLPGMGHNAQTVPATAEKDPAAHGLHVGLPAVAIVPRLHACGCAVPPAHATPAAHCVPVALVEPGGHEYPPAHVQFAGAALAPAQNRRAGQRTATSDRLPAAQ